MNKIPLLFEKKIFKFEKELDKYQRLLNSTKECNKELYSNKYDHPCIYYDSDDSDDSDIVDINDDSNENLILNFFDYNSIYKKHSSDVNDWYRWQEDIDDAKEIAASYIDKFYNPMPTIYEFLLYDNILYHVMRFKRFIKFQIENYFEFSFKKRILNGTLFMNTETISAYNKLQIIKSKVSKVKKNYSKCAALNCGI